MDNYNAPTLAMKLNFMKTDCVGSLHLKRKNIPKIVKEKKLRGGVGDYSSAFWSSVLAEMV
jgi:hypothetical protein